MPSIPEKFDWANEERPISTHTAGVAGFVRYSGPQLMLAGITLAIGAGLLALHFTKGPQSNTLLPALIFGPLAIPLVVWAFIRFQGVIPEVRLYPSGVLWRRSGKWEGLRWEQIEEVYRTEVRVNGGVSVKHVKLKSGRKEAILEHALGSWEKMAERIQMETTMRQSPLAQGRVRGGETVRFGEVSIGPDGLTLEKQLVPFDQMKDVRINNGTLIVFTKGKKEEVKVASLTDMPNLLVFLKLLEQSEAPALKMGMD